MEKVCCDNGRKFVGIKDFNIVCLKSLNVRYKITSILLSFFIKYSTIQIQ